MRRQSCVFYRMVIVVGLAATVAGCSTPGRSSATKAINSIAVVQQRLDTGEQQMQVTWQALVDLINNPEADVKAQYGKYLDGLGKLEAQIKNGQSERAAMRSQAEAYFAKWQQEIQSLQNEDIKKVASSRRDAVKASFQKIDDEFNQAKPDFESFISDLKDIQKALDFDLTPGGIAAIKPVVTKVQQEAATVKTHLTAIRAELASVSSELAATAPSAQ